MAGEGTQAVFVGRENELAQLLAGLDDAVAGHGRLFLIAGEPGIGKSRLAEGGAARARAAGHVILSGRCWEAGGAPPYWPWVQSIRTYVRGIDRELLQAQLGSGASDVIQLLPELRELLPNTAEPSAIDTDAARFRLFDSVTTFLTNACADRPLVFVLEDLHAADTPSLLLLEFLARSLTNMRALVIGTYRDVEVTREHPLAGTLVEVAREAATRRIVLGGLQASEVLRFIAATTGVAPSEALVEGVFRETEGNPLFVGEIVRLLASEGRLSGESAGPLKPIPQGIRDVIVRRISHLSERCSHVLELASVLGREFTLDVLGEMSELQTDELLGVLDEAEKARLVMETPGVLGGMRFSHALIRDTLYEGFPTARRARLHRSAGEALEHLRGDHPDHLAELAHHFFVAAPIGGAEKAIDYARRAAEAAQSGLAFEEAARLYDMSLQAMRIGETGDEGTRFDILVALGDVLNRAGDAESARTEFLEAAAIARRRKDAEGLARATLGYGGRFPWTALRGDPHFVPLLEETLAALGEVETSLRVMVIGRLAAGPLRDDPNTARRRDLSQQALTMARALKDPATLAYALEARLGSIMGFDLISEIFALTDEIERVATATGDGERVLMAHVWRLTMSLYRGDMRAVSSEHAHVVRLGEQLRQGPQNWFILCTEASLAVFAGRFDEAQRLSVAAYEAGRRAESYALFAHRLQMLWIGMEQGRTKEVEELFRDSMDRFSIFPVWQAILPYLLLTFGTPESARAALDEALAGPTPFNEEWSLAQGVLAEAVVSLGDTDAAASLYEELLPYADLTMGGLPDINVGSLRRPIGRLAALLGKLDEAELHLRRAIEENDRMGARPWAAHARFDFARMLLDRDAPGDRENAETLLAEARAAARALGMRPLQEQCEAFLSGPVAAPPLDARAGGPGVFRRDGDVYSISFDGQSFRLRDSKGLRYLAVLLGSPGREHHALELVAAVEGLPVGGRSTEEANVTGSIEELLDADARAAYKRRLADLEDDIAEAEEFGDAERAARAREEQEFVAHELAAAMGLGGKSRKAASDGERARVNVTRAIRSAIGRIAENAAALGDHLNATISTGSFCSYTPDPRAPLAWRT